VAHNDRQMEIDSDEWKPDVKHKKDTKLWCGGHVGREHVKVITKRQGPYVPDCGMRPSLLHPEKEVWHCTHNVACETCHKVLDVNVPEDCPDLQAA
jgi:hypothetical protein